MMVRKAMEVLCHEKGATRGDLKERIKKIGEDHSLSSTLIDSLTEIRYLGNEAAHPELREYMEISIEEANAGLDVAEYILSTLYGGDLMLERIRALKK